MCAGRAQALTRRRDLIDLLFLVRAVDLRTANILIKSTFQVELSHTERPSLWLNCQRGVIVTTCQGRGFPQLE
jgi:hypothetical protein